LIEASEPDTGETRVEVVLESTERAVAPGFADMCETVALMQRIPDSARTFEVTPGEAWGRFRLPADTVEALLAAGISRGGSEDGPLFDADDLYNVSVRLDLGSPHRTILSWWVRELTSLSGRESTGYRLDYVAGCPDPSHDSACRYEFPGPDATSVSVRAEPTPTPQVLGQVDVRARVLWPALPAAVAELVEEFADIEFLRIPTACRIGDRLTLDRRIGDCQAVASLLVEQGLARGLTARMSFGRAFTPPFSSAHHWADFLVDEVWTPVDPLMIGLLHRMGLPADTWGPGASIGGILGRFAERAEPWATHNGSPFEPRMRCSAVTTE
jgi:hypothetical protein